MTSLPDTSEGVNPMTLPWNCQPTAPNEQGAWEDLRHDIMDAFDDGALTASEVRWYLTLMVEMFDSGGERMRSPGHVLAARLCFLDLEVGEA